MVVAVSSHEVQAYHAVAESGNEREHTDYFTDGLQAYRTEMIRGTIEPHYHPVNQFQVVVGGSGTFNRKPVTAPAFQYTDAYTPYGPIVTGPDGVSRFTLRPISNRETYPMPASREKMKPRKAGRTIMIQPSTVTVAPGEAVQNTLIDPHSDGLAAYELVLGPRSKITGPTPEHTRGQYYVLVDGEVDFGDRVLPTLSLLWAEGGDEPPVLSTEEGARLLVLQYPVE